jgi:hypothetical protein
LGKFFGSILVTDEFLIVTKPVNNADAAPTGGLAPQLAVRLCPLTLTLPAPCGLIR